MVSHLILVSEITVASCGLTHCHCRSDGWCCLAPEEVCLEIAVSIQQMDQQLKCRSMGCEESCQLLLVCKPIVECEKIGALQP